MTDSCCPTCKRPFKAITDYPEVSISSFERHKVPVVEHNSMFRPPESIMQEILAELDGYLPLQDYLARLEELSSGEQERTILPKELLPGPRGFLHDSYFSWAYKLLKTDVSGTQIWLALQNPELGTCQLEIYTMGPNFGSGGGPSLLSLGCIATIKYTGVLS